MDDSLIIEKNHYVKNGVSSWCEIFSNKTELNCVNSQNSHNGLVDEHGNYLVGKQRPLSLLSHSLDVEFFGMNPRRHHATNVILTIFLMIILYQTNFKIFQLEKTESLLLTLLFLAHPIHVESIANIKGRDDILSMIFGLIAFQMFFRQQKFGIWITLVFLILSILSKESGIIYAVLIPIVHAGKKPNCFNVHVIKTYLPFFVLLIGFVLKVLFIDKLFGDLADNVYNNSINLVPGKFDQIIFALSIFSNYFANTVLPKNLMWDYSVGVFNYTDDSYLFAFITITVIAFSFYVYLRNWQKEYLIQIGLLFYFIPLFITSNIFVKIPSTFGDRFLFVPVLGYCFLLVWVIKNWTLTSKFVQHLIMILLILIYSGMSYCRIPYWFDSKSLITEDLKKKPSIRTMWSNVALVAKDRKFDSAVILINGILEADTHPRRCLLGNKEILYVYRGKYFELMGFRDLAIKDFEHALRLNDTMFDANSELSRALYRKGKSYLKDAIFYMNRAINSRLVKNKIVSSDSALSINLQDLSVMYFHEGKIDSVRYYMLKSIEYGNRNPKIINDVSRLLVSEKEYRRCYDLLNSVPNICNGNSELEQRRLLCSKFIAR